MVKQKRTSEVSPSATEGTDKKAAVFLDYVAQKKHMERN